LDRPRNLSPRVEAFTDPLSWHPERPDVHLRNQLAHSLPTGRDIRCRTVRFVG
jgi:hypothetical protein